MESTEVEYRAVSENGAVKNEHAANSSSSELLQQSRSEAQPETTGGDSAINLEELVPLKSVWPGRHQPACGGRTVRGPERVMIWLVSLLIWGTLFVYAGTICPQLAKYTHPALIVPWAILMLVVCVSYYVTHFIDPGLLPRRHVLAALGKDYTFVRDELTDEQKKQGTKQSYLFMDPYSGTYRSVCRTCDIPKPPRSHHCSVCDACVELFDHHCPWVGNCVGKRNKRWFVAFITSTSLTGAYVLGSCIALTIIIANESTADAWWDRLLHSASEAPMSIPLAVWGLFFMSLLGPFACYHCSLLLDNETTKERIKQTSRKGGDKQKYDPEFDADCKGFWCKATPAPEVPWNQHVPEILPKIESMIDYDEMYKSTWGGSSNPPAVAPPPVHFPPVINSPSNRKEERATSKSDDESESSSVEESEGPSNLSAS